MKDNLQFDHYINNKNNIYKFQYLSSAIQKKQNQHTIHDKKLDLDQINQFLQIERQLLLRQRNSQLSNKESQDITNQSNSFIYPSKQLFYGDNLGSKFDTKNINNRNTGIHLINDKMNQLKLLTDKLVFQCLNQSLEVKKGLSDLKQAQIRIIIELHDLQQAKQRRIDEIQDYLNQNNKYTQKNIFNQIKRLRFLIQMILNNCHSNNRQGLQNLKKLHKRILIQIERQQQTLSRGTIEQVDSIDSKDNQVFKELQPIKKNIGSNNSNMEDQLQGLNDIQTKVFNQILRLREQKLELVKQINEEIRKNNDITRQYRKLQKDYLILKSKLDNNYEQINYNNSQSFQKITKLNYKNQGQQYTQKLKKEINRLELQLQKNQTYIHKQKADNESKKLKAIITKLEYNIEKLKQQNYTLSKLSHISNQKYPNQSEIQNLKEVIVRLQINLKQSRERNKQLQETVQNYFKLQQELNRLKYHNEQLRMETIRLHKSKAFQSRQSNQQIENYKEEIQKLKNYIAKENQEKLKFIEQITVYKKNFRKYEQQNKILKQKLDQLQKQLQESKKANNMNIQITKRKSSKSQWIKEDKRNKYDLNWNIQQKYDNDSIKQINEKKKQLDNERLRQYKELLNGLRNIRTQI